MEVAGGERFGDGVVFGYTEALRTAKLIQKETLEVVTWGNEGVPVRASGVATWLIRRGAQVILARLSDEDTQTAARECDRAGAIFINCGARGNDLRKEICSPLVFHVEASDAMYESARKVAPPGGEIALWSARLEKYGAAQLNDRFGAAEGAPMRAADWAGWFAIKVIWESLLRTGKADAVSIARYMSTDGVTFDGHKGAPLSFRTWDHQLRQPLYAMPRSSSAPPREIPDTSRSAGSIRDMLDTLGDSASAIKCNR
jgi:ABC-type branched-subunit amino acid transport system substrate-binding protein